MEQTTFDDLWTLMSKYTFKMETDSLMTDFSCIICNKIMIDACVSNCGCKYCYKCLNEYLSGENKYCPGDKADCKEVKLVYGISYMRNNLINNKILNVKVHCPFESCEFTDKIIKIEDHLKICSKQISDCPYISLGCHHKESKDRITHHLYDHTLEHTNVLINYVDNINKEKCDLKEDLEMCKREIKFLKEDSQLKIKNIIIEQGKMMETLSFNIKEIKEQLQKKEIQILQLIDEGKCFKEELRKRDIKIAEQNREIETLFNNVNEIKEKVEETKRDVENQKREIIVILNDQKENEMNKDSNQKEIHIIEKIKELKVKEIKNLQEDLQRNKMIKQIRIDIDTLKITNQNKDKEIGEIKEELKIVKLEFKEKNQSKKETTKKNVTQSVEENKKRNDSLTKRMETLYPRTNVLAGEILFRVEKFSERILSGECVLSPYFYSHFNGYKLRLEVWTQGGKDSLWVYFVICKGKHDDELPWPCKNSINLSIINEREGLDRWRESIFNHSSATDKRPFERPKNEDGDNDEGPLKVSHADLRRILQNDVVLIRARVSAPL